MSDLRSLHLLGAVGQARTEQHNGREHLVVPVVALMEGVIRAINARHPEFVPGQVLTKSPGDWNGHPLVLGHPVKDGRQISAHDPLVMEKHGFGEIRQAKMNGKRLGLEALIDPARLEELGRPDVLTRLRNGDPISVSVGAFVRTLDKPGVHNGKPYAAEWAEIVPDHLAFLPDGRGACSLEMGCGSGRFAMVAAEGFRDATDEEIEALGGPGSGPQKTGKIEDIGHGVTRITHPDIAGRTDYHGPGGHTSVVSELTQGGMTHAAALHHYADGVPTGTSSSLGYHKDAAVAHSRAATRASDWNPDKPFPKFKGLGGPGSGPSKANPRMRKFAGKTNSLSNESHAAYAKRNKFIMTKQMVIGDQRPAPKNLEEESAMTDEELAALGGPGSGPQVGSMHTYNNPGHPMHGHVVQVTKQLPDGSVKVRSQRSSDRRKSDGDGPVIRSVVATKSQLKSLRSADDSEEAAEDLEALGGPGSGPQGGAQSRFDTIRSNPANKVTQVGSVTRVDTASGHTHYQGPGGQASVSMTARGPMLFKEDPKSWASKKITGTGDLHKMAMDHASGTKILGHKLKGAEELRSAADDSEEAAELIGYDTLKSMLVQVGSGLGSASAIVDELISAEVEDPTETAEGEDAEEEIETARLESIQTYCVSMYSNLNAAMSLISRLLAPDTDNVGDASPRYMAGRRNSASDQTTIQAVHDGSVQLGADCSAMKAAASACGCGGSMTKEVRAATIRTLIGNPDSGLTLEDAKWLEQVPDDRLETMKTLSEAKLLALAKSPADSIIQNKANADAAIAAHAHGLNAADQDAAAKKLAKMKKDADGAKDDEGDDEDVKAAAAKFHALEAENKKAELRVASAKKAGLSLEEYDEQEYLKSAPASIRAMAAEHKTAKAARKTELILSLKAASDVLTEEQLTAKTLDQLEELAKFAKIEPVDYSGRGVAVARTAEERSKDVFLNPPDPYAAGIEKMRAAAAAKH